MNKKILLYGLIIILFLCGVVAPILILEKGKRQVYEKVEHVEPASVAIVFGAGIKRDGTPKDMLKDRLIIAAQLYRADKIDAILVSGDNRFVEYNEPDVMYNYLVDVEKIPAQIVFRDYSGRSTYETCVRAREIWDVENALLISQGYHLPRAIFTCRGMGIQSAGISGTRHEYLGATRYKIRELLAIHKALFDVYIFHPASVGGEKEEDLSP